MQTYLSHTHSVRSRLRGSAAGCKTGAAVATRADNVVARRKQVDTSAEVGAACAL